MSGPVSTRRALAWAAGALIVLGGLCATLPDEAFLYARVGGIWRCVTHFAAVADADLVGALHAAFFEAHAEVRDAEPASLATYGLGDQRLRVTFHGPRVLEADDRDVLLAFEVGAALDGHGFVRREGEPAVLAIDAAPRALLDRPVTQSVPPLLDRRVLAGLPKGPSVGFERFRFQRLEGESFEVRREAVGGDEPGWRWVLRRGATPADGDPGEPVPPERAFGFISFALRANWFGFANPAAADDLGRTPAVGAVRLTPLGAREGEVIELVVGQPRPQGLSSIQNRSTGMLVQVDAQTARLFAPDAGAFVDPNRENPWQLWLGR